MESIYNDVIKGRFIRPFFVTFKAITVLRNYQITETKTVNGHSLLKDPIKVTLPIALTQKEAAAKRADTTKAKYDKTNGLYYFYDVTYDVDNEAIPSVPMTGAFDNWKTFVPIILAMALFIGVGIYQMKKKKKPAK